MIAVGARRPMRWDLDDALAVDHLDRAERPPTQPDVPVVAACVRYATSVRPPGWIMRVSTLGGLNDHAHSPTRRGDARDDRAHPLGLHSRGRRGRAATAPSE